MAAIIDAPSTLLAPAVKAPRRAGFVRRLFRDKTLGAVMKSGEIDKIYAKWFTSPIPPKGINLNFPMTPAIKDAFKTPNDKGV